MEDAFLGYLGYSTLDAMFMAQFFKPLLRDVYVLFAIKLSWLILFTLRDDEAQVLNICLRVSSIENLYQLIFAWSRDSWFVSEHENNHG